jgi:hypothetical protein
MLVSGIATDLAARPDNFGDHGRYGSDGRCEADLYPRNARKKVVVGVSEPRRFDRL